MPAWIVIVEKKICNNFKTFGNGKSMKTSKLPYLWKYKKINNKIWTWPAEHSMMRQQHVNKEKLNKSILNASVDTVLCLTLLCVEGSNVLETLIYWTNYIGNCLVLLFEASVPFSPF
jgi:hypothetical protein